MTFNTITIPAQGESRPEGRGALAAYAYQQIRDQLIYCRYQGGERLVLRPLAASLGLSPTPVREALLRLVSEQALVLDERNTACVPLTSRPVFLDIHGVREVLEERVTRDLAAHITPEQIAVLEEKHKAFIAAYEAGEPHATAITNVYFHSTGAGFSRLSVTVGLIRGLWTRMGPIYAAANGLPTISPANPDHPHLQLLEAFREGDADAAVKALKRDFMQAKEWLEPLLPG
ncbi:GntR family transcriptional regulator [Acetobacter fabarum]|uniref:GntR family transcriptional regulator n=1 Tax=Acetobacter fabarum TaxID=483199 RepID=UPI00312BAEFA